MDTKSADVSLVLFRPPAPGTRHPTYIQSPGVVLDGLSAASTSGLYRAHVLGVVRLRARTLAR